MRTTSTCAILGCFLWGCGVSDGDYVVYRVGVERETISDGCYTMTNPRPLDDAGSSATLLTSETFVIYYGAGDKVVLDAAGTSYGGEETGDGFEFLGHDVNVSYVGIDNLEAKVTFTTEITINITEDGDGISGDGLAKLTVTCDFLTATPSPNLCEQLVGCERRQDFFGVEIPDVDLDTVVNETNPI